MTDHETPNGTVIDFPLNAHSGMLSPTHPDHQPPAYIELGTDDWIAEASTFVRGLDHRRYLAESLHQAATTFYLTRPEPSGPQD
jgi:hypothetical protein